MKSRHRLPKRPRLRWGELETFWEDWMALTPAERLRRSCAMLASVPDLRALHDAKLFPKP